MKKIGLLAFGSKDSGGIYQYTQSIIEALKIDSARQYIIFCNTDDTRFDQCEIEVRKIDKPRNNIFEKVVRSFQQLLLIRKPLFFSLVERNVFKDIDLFLSPTISAYPHYYLNTPFIFTLHDMQERYYPQFFSTYERCVRWLSNRALSKSAIKIVCESQYVKNDIIKFINIENEKIKIIQSPPPAELLDYEFTPNGANRAKAKYQLPEKYIFYPAQCWFHKNHIKLLEAFYIVSKEYDNVSLILTGSQQNNYKSVMDKVDELGLSKKVNHLGYIDYEDLPYLYKMSQMLVMPSLFESVSIPVYEAFALGVPVCCSNVVALPEQVGTGGLIFNPDDENDIASKILCYLNDEKLALDMSEVGINSVKEFNHFNYQKELLSLLPL